MPAEVDSDPILQEKIKIKISSFDIKVDKIDILSEHMKARMVGPLNGSDIQETNPDQAIKNKTGSVVFVREAAKKILFLVARPLRGGKGLATKNIR